MSVELQQSALNAAGEKASVAVASGLTTAAAGVSTYFQIIPALLGSIASATGIIISCGLFYLSWKKNRLERKQLHLQIAVLEEKEAERIERSKLRKEQGKPTRREDDN